MSAELLKQLLRAYASQDPDLFRKSALQIAANESKNGHSRLAEELREIIAAMPEVVEPVHSPVNISQPRGELADLIHATFRQERLKDIILDDSDRKQISRIIMENRRRSDLLKAGVSATRRLLFFGPPGCGKTLAAQVLAGELGLPLMTVRFDALFSKFLGTTAAHLRAIFDEMPRRPGVYFFDEFDALGKQRDDAVEVGEIKRVVSSFLQLLDSDKSHSLIIAATNYEKILDQAIIRRFDGVTFFPLPKLNQLKSLVLMRLQRSEITSTTVSRTISKLKNVSYADIARACDDVLRTLALENRSKATEGDLKSAFRTLSVRTELISSR